MQNVLLMTNGDWNNTTLVNPDFPVGENGIEAVKVYIHLKVERNGFDQIVAVNADAYGVLTATPTERLPLFPGQFEALIGQKSLVVANTAQLIVDGETLPDPNGWVITSSSLDTFDDPVRDYTDRAGYMNDNLFDILDELIIILDVEADQMLVELSLFEAHTFSRDLITKITLLTN